MKIKTKKESVISLRHRNLLKKLSDNIRNGMTLGEAMRDVGYSDAYSKNPNHLRETVSWQVLVNKVLSDEKLIKVHAWLLKHKNWRARDAGLDKAYKLKKKYGDITIQHKFGELTDEDIEGEITGIFSEAIGLAEREKKKSGK